jgi:hypothetical protein
MLRVYEVEQFGNRKTSLEITRKYIRLFKILVVESLLEPFNLEVENEIFKMKI